MLRRKEFHRPEWIVALSSTVRPTAATSSVATVYLPTSATALSIRRSATLSHRSKFRSTVAYPCNNRDFRHCGSGSWSPHHTTRTFHVHHTHHRSTNIHRGGYDPELAACMDRWVRSVSHRLFARPKTQPKQHVVSVARRKIGTSSCSSTSRESSTSLARNERSAADLEVKGVAQHEILCENRSVQSVEGTAINRQIPDQATTTLQTPSTTQPIALQQQQQQHSALYNEFRTFLKSLTQPTESIAGGGTRKKGRRRISSRVEDIQKSLVGVGENGHQGENQEMFIQSSAILESTQLDPDDVERLWQYYTRLVWSGDSLTNQGVANIQQTTEEAYRPPSLTLLEYEQLMDLIGHTTSRVGGGMREKRVLQLYDDAKRTGLVPSTQMYAWVVNAAFEALAAPTTIRAIYSDFVRSHHHRRSAAISEKASKDTWKRDQERLLKVIVNGFATKGMILQGIEFLDTAVHYEDPDLVQSLYARLVQSHFAQEEHYTGVLRHKHADRDRIVEFFRRKASLSYDRIRRLMTRLENSDDGAILLKELSSHGLGSLLIQMREQQSLGALLVSLLRQSHMDEAIRLLDAMVDKDIMPPLTTIRTRLVRSMPKNGNQAQRARMEQILHAWDDATGSRGLFVLDAIKTVSDGREIDLEHDPLTPASRAREWTQQPQLRWELPGRSTQDYEAMIESLIRKQELGTAVDVAKYFASRGWKSQNLDFLKLNSFMINFSTSDRFIQYFHVRFLLGPAARPDLHTFRRFIYASCRRSDLYTALSLFQILRTTRPEGKLDATLYNPIISAASSIPGRMPVAEKMFQAMRQSGVKPDLYTYHAMLNGYANAGNLEAAKRIPPLMLQHGLEPTTKTFNLVIKAYLRARNDISTCRRLLKIMEKSPMDVGPDQVTINMLLESYHKTGNDFWLDHFLENYVTEAGRQATTDPSSESMSSADVQKSKSRQSCNQLEQAPSDQQQQQKPSELAYRHLIAMSKQGDSHPDYWTMHSVLKLALWETNISVDKVWSLWKAMKVHILAPSDQPITYVPFTKVLSSSDRKSTAAHSGPVTSNTSGSAATTTTTNTAPKTVTRTMSNDDYFKWTTLQLFWHAFKQQGDVRGIKMVNRVALDLFPDKTLQFSSSSSSSADSQSSGGTTSSIDQTLSTSLFAKTWKEFSQHMAAHSVTAKQAAVERRAASQEALQKLVADQQALKVAEAHRERRHQVATRERFGSSWALSKQQQQQQQQQQLHPSSQPSHKDEDTSHNEGDNQ